MIEIKLHYLPQYGFVESIKPIKIDIHLLGRVRFFKSTRKDSHTDQPVSTSAPNVCK